MKKNLMVLACLLCCYCFADAQTTPLFNDHLDMSKLQKGPIPRSFDADDLLVKDAQGKVIRDLRESPCWKEIGYNPDLSKQAIINEYDYCESEKRKKTILTWVIGLIVVGTLGAVLRSTIRKANSYPGTR